MGGTLQKYRGYRNFKNYQNICGWNSDQSYRALQLLLSGNALQLSLEKPHSNVEELAELLKKYSTGSNSYQWYFYKIIELKQKPHQTVSQYETEFNDLVFCLNILVENGEDKIGDKQSLSCFIRGLKYEIKKELILKNPNSYLEALTMSKQQLATHRKPGKRVHKLLVHTAKSLRTSSKCNCGASLESC